MLKVTLYTKPDCPLCDEVKHLLDSLRDEVAFAVEEHNILDNPEEQRRFQHLIPVVDVAGGPLLYPPHDWLTLRTALHAARRALRNETHANPAS